MRIGIFEDPAVDFLEPLTLTRPAFDLRCGRSPLIDRLRRWFGGGELGAVVRPELAEFYRLQHPEMPVNDDEWLKRTKVLVNARWLPGGAPPDELRTPRVALVGNQVAYAVLRDPVLPLDLDIPLDGELECWKHTLPRVRAGGAMIDHPWDLVEWNGRILQKDYEAQHDRRERGAIPPGLSLIGPEERLVLDPMARIEPCVVIDTTKGPVLLDQDVLLGAFTRVEGPCHLGAGTQVFGARIKGTSAGPMCRLGGEIEESILQGHCNKYHDGFLGHSYVGEWVNLGAGTQTSDLRNDYEPVSVTINQRRIETGLTKVGAFLGDHTKTALGSLLNTGTVAGAFCNLLPTGGLLPQVVPSFCTVWYGQVREAPDMEPLFKTAARVMERRGRRFTEAQAAFFRGLYERTASQRQAVVQASAVTPLRA